MKIADGPKCPLCRKDTLHAPGAIGHARSECQTIHTFLRQVKFYVLQK